MLDSYFSPWSQTRSIFSNTRMVDLESFSTVVLGNCPYAPFLSEEEDRRFSSEEVVTVE